MTLDIDTVLYGMTKQPHLTHVRDQALVQANSSYNVHDHLKGLSVEELQEISSADRLPWHTLCLNVTGDLNVGTMIRTSHCMGAKSVIVYGRQRIDSRSLVGAANYVKVEKITGIENEVLDVDAFVSLLNERSLTPIFVETNGIPINKVNWKTRIDAINRRGDEPCLVMGNETGGIPSDLLTAASYLPNSFTVQIPQRGVIRSMNVAVAHAMVVQSMTMSMEW